MWQTSTKTVFIAADLESTLISYNFSAVDPLEHQPLSFSQYILRLPGRDSAHINQKKQSYIKIGERMQSAILANGNR